METGEFGQPGQLAVHHVAEETKQGQENAKTRLQPMEEQIALHLKHQPKSVELKPALLVNNSCN